MKKIFKPLPMKNNVFFFFLATIFVVTAVSCKNDKQQTKTQDAQDALTASETAVVYLVDTNASTIEWSGRKPTKTHTGTIKIASGSFTTSLDNSIESGDFIINMKSISVTDLEPGNGKENLEGHLMGTVSGKEGDFFDTNKYPEGIFEVTGVKIENGKTWLQGNLTLKEVTKNIEFPINVSFEEDKMLLQSESFTLNRTLWGINFGSKSVFDNLGDKFISDDMEITVSIEANKA